MKKLVLLGIVLVIINLAIARQLPCEYWGTVSIAGNPAVNGLPVEAYVNSQLLTIMQGGTYDGHYQLIIESDNPQTPNKDGAVTGDSILIKIDGKDSSPTVKWQSGEINRHDILISGCLNSEECNDGNICTNDICENGNCIYFYNTAICDDGLYCTVTDKCNSGYCIGVTKDCSDGDSCTNDYCSEEQNNCLHNNQCDCENDIDCEDGNICTTNVCVDGRCVSQFNTKNCDDNLWCTVDDICSFGQCAGLARVCNDNNGCTTDSCDEQRNICSHLNTCDCVRDVDCDDNNICTHDFCINGKCTGQFNTNNCDDNLWCTVDDVCTLGQCAGQARVCNDNIECTFDSCDEQKNICSHLSRCNCASDLDCNDNDDCTVDTCNNTCNYENVCCQTNWICSSWSGCIDRTNTRNCYDANSCNNDDGKPVEIETCAVLCLPNWKCTKWGSCNGEERERSCVDLNKCNTNIGKPEEEKDCKITIHEQPIESEIKTITIDTNEFVENEFNEALPPKQIIYGYEPTEISYSNQIPPIVFLIVSIILIISCFSIILVIFNLYRK
ncbi:MAG: hypothetical protein ABIC04_08290 [Nanoarchaeota archaeon]